MNKWIEHVKFYTAGWFFASIFFYLLRQVGVASEAGVNISPANFIFLLPIFTLVPGFVFGTLQYFFEKFRKRKIPLWKLLMRLFVDQFLIVSLIAMVFYLAMRLAHSTSMGFIDYIKSPSAFILNLFVFISNAFFAFLIEIIRLLGRGNFIKLITGRFYNPQEEYRIFMFIDLNSSTTIAEKLGHFAYSNFIQDCFSDLAIVNRYNTEIYQYVGDEAVLTWERSKIKSATQCIDAFWAFVDKLSRKTNYYQKKYGIIPEFKGGMSIGMVTVVEIGDFKKEIAYHGNTLNTTSRLVELCNIYGEKLLITKKLYDEFAKEKSQYIFKKVTETQLRGKQGLTSIYSVNRPVGEQL